MRLVVLCLLASALLSPLSRAQVPVFVITPEQSTIKFYVKSSVDIEGHFDKWDATLTFTSTKIVRTSPTTFQVQGNFTIRGVTKPDALLLTSDTEGKGVGEIKGTMAFDRKDYGVDGSIPFIKIADRVEVTIAFQAKRVSGPPVIFEH